jgi:hypothetical protein
VPKQGEKKEGRLKDKRNLNLKKKKGSPQRDPFF